MYAYGWVETRARSRLVVLQAESVLLGPCPRRKEGLKGRDTIAIESTPRGERARAKGDKRPELLGGRLTYCFWLGGTSGTDKVGLLD